MKTKLISSLIIACCITLLQSCASLMPLSNAKTYAYSYALVNTDSTIKNDMSFSDDKIDIIFSIEKSSINFQLKNKTNEVIKIIWDETVIVQDNASKKVMHAGVKYTDRNLSQTPSVIAPTTTLTDLVLPVDNVYFQEGYYSQYYSRPAEWKEHDLYPTSDLGNAELASLILQLKNQKFVLYLSVMYQDKTINYPFIFKIIGVKQLN